MAASPTASLFYKWAVGKAGHTERVFGWYDLVLQAIPKPRKEPEQLRFWSHFCLSCTLFELHDRLPWTALPHAMALLLPVLFGFVKGAQAMAVTEYLRTTLRKAHEWDHALFTASLGVEGFRPN